MFLTQKNLFKLLCKFLVCILHVLFFMSTWNGHIHVPFLHKRYAECVAMVCSMRKQKTTVFFKYKNIGQFAYIQGFLSWQIIYLVTSWNFSYVYRQDINLNRFWSDLLKSFWHFYSTNLVSCSNVKISRKLKSHLSESQFRYLRLFCGYQKCRREPQQK